MATQLDRPHSSAAWLRGALHGLVLAISNILAIVITFALWVLLNRPAPQIVVQGALAALLTLALFAAWMWLVQRLPVGELAWHDRRDAMTTYVSALVWAPLLFVPLHLLTQGYLTAIGNIVALWLFQVPVNLAAVWLAGRVSSGAQRSNVMKPHQLLSLLFAAFLAVGLAMPLHAQSPLTREEITWFSEDANGDLRVHLYFFWSETCPHCQEAHPFIVETLPAELPWLELHSLELTEYPENGELYASMAAALGSDAMYVPAFFYCGVMTTGYEHAETTGAQIKQSLIECRAQAQARLESQSGTPETGDAALEVGAAAVTKSESSAAPGVQPDEEAQHLGVNGAAALTAAAAGEDAAASALTLPLLGQVNAQGLPLPFLTLVIAGADAFNPCAFFVLMFLLSLMVRSGSRSRMLLIGGVFVFVSGLLYFLFMAAWLNVFRWIGELTAITFVAGLIAIGIALVNIKDYFWYKQGVSLTIPDSAKPGLYARTRNIVTAGSLPAMLVGAGALAIAANTYELLCTFGFPMVYTRILTMHDLPAPMYYLYLLAYNLIYVIPLLLIVLGFSVVLESRRLTEREGRVLKLLSGLMMLLLGLVLVFVPAMLNQVGTAVLILSLAILVTLVIALQELALKLVSGAALVLLAAAYLAAPAAFEQLGSVIGLFVATLLLTAVLVWLDRRRHPAQHSPLTGGIHTR